MSSEFKDPSFRHPATLLPLTIVGLVCFVLLDALYIPAGIFGIIGIEQHPRNDDLVVLSTLIRGISGLGQLLMFIWTTVCFCMLIYRFAHNARAIGFTSFNHTPGWCVGWFFIPFAHLWMPYKANSEIWQSSKVSDSEQIRQNEWWEQPIGLVFKLWWFAWVFGNIGNNTASRLSQSTFEPLELAGYWLIPFAGALQVSSAILAIMIVSKLASRQRTQFELMQSQHQAGDPFANDTFQYREQTETDKQQ